MQTILSTRIAAPMFMFAAPDEAGGGTETAEAQIVKDADGAEVLIEPRIEGEEAPNFDIIDAETGNVAEPEEKPATTPPNAKKGALEDTPIPEIEKEKPKEEAKVVVEPEKKAEKAVIPKDDTDLDEIKLKPGTNPKVGEQFGKAKEQTKLARQAARELQVELAAIATQKAELETRLAAVKPLDEPTEKELAELRTFKQQTLLENDPALIKEYADKTAAVETRLLAMLVENGMTQENADKMKAMGIDKYPYKWWNDNVFTKVEDGLEVEKMKQCLMERVRIQDDKKAKVAAIAADKDKLTAEQTEKEKARWNDFGQKLDARAKEITKEHAWANPVEVKDTMSAEEKAAANVHNAKYAELNKAYIDKAQKIVSLQHPEVLAETLCKSFLADRLGEDNAALKAEGEKKDTRIAELEEQIAGINKTGRIGDKNGAPPAKRQAAAPKYDQSSEEAFEDFMKER